MYIDADCSSTSNINFEIRSKNSSWGWGKASCGRVDIPIALILPIHLQDVMN
jgi:hypothetical protein